LIYRPLLNKEYRIYSFVILIALKLKDDDDLARVLKQAEPVIAEAEAAIVMVESDQKIKYK